METKTESIHFDKKFGLITAHQLVLTTGNSEDKIPFASIEKVNLIKYRVFYTNVFLFLFSCVLLFFPTLVLDLEKEKIFPFVLLGLLVLIFSFSHKFYFYRMVIKENNTSTHIVKTSQLNRKCIKNFYFLVSRKVPKKK